jgi:hypothetical protein
VSSPFSLDTPGFHRASKAIDVNLLLEPIERALQERKRRKIREQIARELEELKAAREK